MDEALSLIMNNDLEYKRVKPEKEISLFVESFWMLQNHSNGSNDIVVLPDGKIDLFFSRAKEEPFRIMLVGLETRPKQVIIRPKSFDFVISFNLLAVEYLLRNPISDLLDVAKNLPDDFWGFSVDDLNDFESFCQKATEKIKSISPTTIDSRKQNLFEFLYLSNGSLTVKEISGKVHWSSRQINRYFNQQFGISLKTYCNILRFRASFYHINEGKLFPQENFADQPHFIREIKKLSGVSPKELNRNKNDRFIQFSTLLPK